MSTASGDLSTADTSTITAAEYRKVKRQFSKGASIEWIYAAFDEDGNCLEILSEHQGRFSPETVADDKLLAILNKESFNGEMATYSVSGMQEETYRRRKAEILAKYRSG